MTEAGVGMVLETKMFESMMLEAYASITVQIAGLVKNYF